MLDPPNSFRGCDPLPGITYRGAGDESPSQCCQNTRVTTTGHTTPEGGVLFPTIVLRMLSHSSLSSKNNQFSHQIHCCLGEEEPLGEAPELRRRCTSAWM